MSLWKKEEVDFSKIVKYLKIIERERVKSECVCFGREREKKEGRKREIKNFILF